MSLRPAALGLAVLACASAVPAHAEDTLSGRWSGSVRTEGGIVSAVVEVQPQRIGKTAGTLSFRGASDWDCNTWLEYAGSVGGVHAYLPRRKNDEGQGIESGCSVSDAYVEIGGEGMPLRWLKGGQLVVEVPLTAEP